MSDEIKALVERGHRKVMIDVALGKWLSAALDDPNVCEEMKADVRAWFSSGEPLEEVVAQQAITLTAQAEEIERLRAALIEEREDNLWEAYNSGNVKDGQWTHMFMSDGEWLARECGFNPSQGHYDDAEIRAAIPRAALKAAAERERAAVEDIDEAELLRRFRAMFRYGEDGKRTTATGFADEHGLSRGFVSDTLAGKKGIADRIANALGYERRVVFRRSEHLKEGR